MAPLQTRIQWQPAAYPRGLQTLKSLCPGAAGSGVLIDEVLKTYSFIYDKDLATSEMSIA